uniref:Plus3 domain-containing protein n=1 Tax=Setaria digitata TaxID=48799 RepID=A0A915PV57_9BILA
MLANLGKTHNERNQAEEISLPPALQRFLAAPTSRSPPSPQLKTVLRLADEDLENVTVHGNSFVFRSNQSGVSKSISKYTFDQIFASDATIQQICSVCLPDLLQTCFSGSDACFIYFGAVSKAKNELLYSQMSRQNFAAVSSASMASDSAGSSSGTPYPGIFPSAFLLTFRLISELRQRRPDFHHSVRISALYYSQRRNLLTDLLASFIQPGTSQDVTIREDSVLGIKIENHSELRVDSVEQAMLMIDDIIQARVIEDENEQRCGHLFFYINLYRYKKNTSQLVGGRSRLCLVDLGLGERTSKGDVQAMTMPVITNLLVALFQGQRYLPSRQSPLCMLLKESLGSVQVKASLLFASLSDRISESENILQMMSKIQRAAKPRKTHRVGSDSSSSDTTRRRLAANSEGNSSSEQSCAETVIFLGPSVRAEPTTESQQSKRRANGNGIDSTKRKMILDWIRDTRESDYCLPAKVSVSVQCNEEDIDMESLQQYGCRRQLDDILEDDEEASGCHSPRSLPTTEQLLECFQNFGSLQQPLSILSLDKISASTSGKSASENEVEDDDLERAMAASISSIRSHEILSRLNDDLSEIHSENTSGSESSLSGIYRRASKLDVYTDEKLRQLSEAYEKKKKKKFVPFNCCRSTMVSSGSSGGYMQASSFSVLKTAEKDETHEASNLLLSALEKPMEHFNSVDTSNAATVPRSNTHPLNNCSVKNSNRLEAFPKSKLPRRTSEVSACKVAPEKPSVLPERTSVQYLTRSSRRDSLDSKRETKKGCESKDDQCCTIALFNGMFFFLVTDVKQDTGAYSSGHGSDENGSIYSRPLLSLLSPRSNRPRNRESFSASSGYESATGVDVAKNYGSLSRRRLFELSRAQFSDKASFFLYDVLFLQFLNILNNFITTCLKPQHTSLMDRRINLMIRRQNRLHDDLRDAKRLLGVADEHFLTASASSLQGATLLEALTQEKSLREVFRNNLVVTVFRKCAEVHLPSVLVMLQIMSFLMALNFCCSAIRHTRTMSNKNGASGDLDSASDVEMRRAASSGDEQVKNSSARDKSNSDSEDNKQTKARRSTRATHQNKKVIESGTSEEDSNSDVEAATSSRKRKTDKKLNGRGKKARTQTDSDEDSSDDSDKKSLVDEYDDDMFLDEEDRRRLEEMTEKDREAEIFKRVEQREILRARHAIQKKIKAQKEDSAGLSKKEKKEKKKKEKEKKREKDGKRKIVESDIDERNAADEGTVLLHAGSVNDDKGNSDEYDEFQRPSEIQKKQKQKNAMADLVNRRKEKQEAAQKKKAQSHKSELDIDEVFGNDGSDDDYEKSSSSSSRSSSRSTSRSTSKSRSRSPSPEKKREVNCLADLSRIRLSRFKISKIVHAPFFNKTVIGCFVRIGIGRNKEGRSVYRAAQILDVVETAKVYQLENTRTNKGLKLKHGKEERVYRLEFVSNSEFTDHEFNKWYDAMKSNNLAILTIDQVEKKEADIQKAVNYNYTDKDIELMVQEKMRFQKAPLNYALEKGNLIKLKASENRRKFDHTGWLLSMMENLNLNFSLYVL